MKKSTAPDRAREPKVRGLQLHSGESVALVVRPARSVTLHKYLMTLGLYGVWRKRKTFVLTNRRVVVGQGVFVRMEWSIPLDRVDDARYTRHGISSYAELVINDRGGRRVERIGPLLPLTAKGFTHAVLAIT